MDTVAIVHRESDIALLRGIGVSAVVQPDFEASLELARHTLRRSGISGLEPQLIVNRFRESHYETTAGT